MDVQEGRVVTPIRLWPGNASQTRRPRKAMMSSYRGDNSGILKAFQQPGLVALNLVALNEVPARADFLHVPVTLDVLTGDLTKKLRLGRVRHGIRLIRTAVTAF